MLKIILNLYFSELHKFSWAHFFQPAIFLNSKLISSFIVLWELPYE